MAVTEQTSQKLQGGQLGLPGVIMPALAASLAARHFSLTEDMLRELHARIRVRSGGKADAGSQDQ